MRRRRETTVVIGFLAALGAACDGDSSAVDADAGCIVAECAASCPHSGGPPYGYCDRDGRCVCTHTDPAWEAGTDADADADSDADADADGRVGGTWVTIDPGTFLMGSPTSEPGRQRDETQHAVTLTRRFELLATEVTQAQFGERMGYVPAGYPECGDDCPVVRVNWHEAASYCNALSAEAGLASCYACSGSGAGVMCDPSGAYATPYDCPGYRLPTEAEWEYAARARTTGGTYNGICDDGHLGCEQPNVVLDSSAWFCGNSGRTTHPVAGLAANPWGLYDMLGNVSEWCHDAWDRTDYGAGSVTDPWGLASGSIRVVRGGSCVDDAAYARAAWRYGSDSGDRGWAVGFRVSRSLPR
jgi:formylglycine-generating enzyme required for sulfatase activity